MLMQLALIGLLVALLPLALVWFSGDADKYRKLAWTALFLTFDLIMFGGFTRLTDSGLGCPDWPGCYGHGNPLSAHEMIRAAETALPSGPVTVFKAWVEMTHRYLAMAVGVLIITLMVIAWRNWLRSSRRARRFSPTFPTLMLLLVCVQGAFGAWTVTMKLQPVVVTTHLLLGMALLATMTWVGASQNTHRPVGPVGRQLAGPALAIALLLALQIALGGWVSTNYAVLACADFPLCQGHLVPPMNFGQGFSLWRHLGMTADGGYLPFSALTAIHWTHRTFAYVVIAGVAWLAYRALKDPGLRRTACALLAVIALQFCTGMATVIFKWPLPIAVMHNGGAALLLLLAVMLNYKIRFAPSPGDLSDPAAFNGKAGKP
ncbi:MAG: cytochrome oxidase subunit [Herbaspirillum sp.]|jgi:cytochrome c oxidase assembly protein subunit 15|nr:cytochrome oxidase subunit [Herbaspirillum sp.]